VADPQIREVATATTKESKSFKEVIMEELDNWKTKTLIIGGIAGLLTGLLAAYLLIQRAEQQEDKPKLTAGEGVKVGVGVLGLLKLIADMGGGHK
jgi:hypothetical protein